MSGINVNSDTWETVSKKVRARISQLRDDLEGEADPIETAEIRGMIRFAREVLKLPESEQPAPVVKSGDYI